ncbi:aldehyde dehydrogenase family protein [Parahaliea maris]|uniref:Aldehyde dehydrogenase family protein n=1 Tax=Parahaliea maris TaxID=2716870 RepID=A0A5C8ZW65_9GAMM|nr:aldehyde dehydrogenase family protein [Parahaliea maris]TXS92004.1 aldehyde dehydrogenase family protein [Parahaliea maris]
MTEPLQVRNPRTGEIDTVLASTTATELMDLAGQARAAQIAWAARTPVERASVLKQWLRALQDRRTELIQALATDTGRLRESELEFDTVQNMLDRWCRQAPQLLSEPGPVKAAIPGLLIDGQAVPYPLVGIISPWNFPLLLALIDAIPGLLAGSAVIVKPSEVTPRFAEVLRASLRVVPELTPLVGIAQGDGSVGAEVLDRVDMVIFTGSVATGRRVAEAAARRFIPAFLELGGKDAALVLDDADVERSAAAITWGGMANAGQSCLSIERVYVAETRYEAFVEALVRNVSALRLNIGQIGRGEIGPVIALRQVDILEQQLQDARERGGCVAVGGELIEQGGIWCQPTVLTGVDHDMQVMTDETFGPILPVMPFASDEAALALANDSVFGLSGAVFSGDPGRARRVARGIEAGAISINDCALTAIVHEGEKQSFKLSGLGGSRMGASSIRRFFRRQALLENTGSTWDPWWFQASP